MNISDFANYSRACSCGRTHTVPIRQIITGAGVSPRFSEMLTDFSGDAYILGDDRTCHSTATPSSPHWVRRVTGSTNTR